MGASGGKSLFVFRVSRGSPHETESRRACLLYHGTCGGSRFTCNCRRARVDLVPYEYILNESECFLGESLATRLPDATHYTRARLQSPSDASPGRIWHRESSSQTIDESPQGASGECENVNKNNEVICCLSKTVPSYKEGCPPQIGTTRHLLDRETNQAFADRKNQKQRHHHHHHVAIHFDSLCRNPCVLHV